MDHFGLLKRAFRITWRYRPLWIFGFLLALCSGGGGGNFNFPGGGSDMGNGEFGGFGDAPDVDPNMIIAIIVGICCLVLVLVVVSLVVQFVSRTALIRMVRQITEVETITFKEGWRMGWSRAAWRILGISLLIGLPITILSILLITIALAPLLLLLTEETVLMVIGVGMTIPLILFVILLLIALGVVIQPLQELAWRRTALSPQGVIDSVRQTVGLIRSRLKDVVIMWLLMLGIGIGWSIISLMVVLPVSLLAALLVGGPPAGLVYLISDSVVGAAVTGIPLAVIVMMGIGGFAGGLYLAYQSSVWTLVYLELESEEPPESEETEADEPEPDQETEETPPESVSDEPEPEPDGDESESEPDEPKPESDRP